LAEKTNKKLICELKKITLFLQSYHSLWGTADWFLLHQQPMSSQHLLKQLQIQEMLS